VSWPDTFRPRDKTSALEHYARQAQNTDAERRAAEIRLRAERKAGQLLDKQLKNGRPEKLSGGPTLSDLGITRDQSSQWQKLGALPQRQFDPHQPPPVGQGGPGIGRGRVGVAAGPNSGIAATGGALR
jgi:hypothetical protein